MSAHAFLGPSSAELWLSCTRGPRAAEGEPDRRSSYADEGSFAHSVAEHCLRHAVRPDQLCGSEPWESSEYWTQDLRDHVCTYLDYIETVISNTAPGGVTFIEQRFDLDQYVPESFGTADCVVISQRVMDVIDLKYGKGILVSPQGNPQLKLYALGAYSTYGVLYDIDTVRLHIVQPRAGGAAEPYELPLSELLAWGDLIKPIARMAFDGEGEFKPGEKTCQWCRIKAKCAARREANMEIVEQNIARSKASMTLSDIALLLPHLDAVISWAQDVKEYALDRATQGDRVPGYKLVAGTSRRVITDPAAVAKVLSVEGIDPYKPADLLGITELERLAGKKKFAELCGEYISKPPGKPTLVPDADKRPALETTAATDADFDAAPDA